jgi:hypothetical protein
MCDLGLSKISIKRRTGPAAEADGGGSWRQRCPAVEASGSRGVQQRRQPRDWRQRRRRIYDAPSMTDLPMPPQRRAPAHRVRASGHHHNEPLLATPHGHHEPASTTSSRSTPLLSWFLRHVCHEGYLKAIERGDRRSGARDGDRQGLPRFTSPRWRIATSCYNSL